MPDIKLSFFFFFLFCCCCYSFGRAVRYCKVNNRIGHCKLYENCSSLDRIRNHADCAHSELSGDVVCCLRKKPPSGRIKSTSSISITTATTTTPATILEKEYMNPRGLALLNQQNCGYIGDSRVGNGIDAILGEFPWIALLLYSQKEPLCGGSVITDRFVLTAAHCIRNDLQFVRLGEHDLSTVDDCLSIGICQTYEEFGIDPKQKPLIHPDYDNVNKYKDVALIKLDNAIAFQVFLHIKPICLPTSPSDYDMLPIDDLELAGWGLTENNEVRGSDILQKGILKPETLDRCQELYSLYTVDKSKLCIRSGRNHTVSCKGDSGSPIFWKTKYKRGSLWQKRYTQIGLVSLGFGRTCGGLTSVPFIYENVTDSMPWITHTILK